MAHRHHSPSGRRFTKQVGANTNRSYTCYAIHPELHQSKATRARHEIQFVLGQDKPNLDDANSRFVVEKRLALKLWKEGGCLPVRTGGGYHHHDNHEHQNSPGASERSLEELVERLAAHSPTACFEMGTLRQFADAVKGLQQPHKSDVNSSLRQKIYHDIHQDADHSHYRKSLTGEYLNEDLIKESPMMYLCRASFAVDRARDGAVSESFTYEFQPAEEQQRYKMKMEVVGSFPGVGDYIAIENSKDNFTIGHVHDFEVGTGEVGLRWLERLPHYPYVQEMEWEDTVTLSDPTHQNDSPKKAFRA